MTTVVPAEDAAPQLLQASELAGLHTDLEPHAAALVVGGVALAGNIAALRALVRSMAAHLDRLDTESSASRQHYIHTGAYLVHDHAAAEGATSREQTMRITITADPNHESFLADLTGLLAQWPAKITLTDGTTVDGDVISEGSDVGTSLRVVTFDGGDVSVPVDRIAELHVI